MQAQTVELLTAIGVIIFGLVSTFRGYRLFRVVLALGGVAHRAVIRAMGLRQNQNAFGHGAEHRLTPHFLLIDSYHCSRYNTQTRRLTTPMFEAVFERAKNLLD